MLLLDRSSRKKFESVFGQERALHQLYRSLDRFNRLRCVLATLQVVQPLWTSKAADVSTITFNMIRSPLQVFNLALSTQGPTKWQQFDCLIGRLKWAHVTHTGQRVRADTDLASSQSTRKQCYVNLGQPKTAVLPRVHLSAGECEKVHWRQLER